MMAYEQGRDVQIMAADRRSAANLAGMSASVAS